MTTRSAARNSGHGLEVAVMRSQLGRVRGLGAAKSGVHHWWVERLTAIALLPLTIWFVVSVLTLLGATQPVVAHWAGRPVNTVLLLALVALAAAPRLVRAVTDAADGNARSLARASPFPPLPALLPSALLAASWFRGLPLLRRRSCYLA